MAADYEITSQQQGNDLDVSGALIDVMRVNFVVIPEQVAGSVTVPLRNYNPETVAAAIQPQVDLIKAVAAL